MISSAAGAGRTRGGGAPIAVQIAAFLVASLVLAQTINMAIVLLAPEPTPPIYQMSEVAAALQGRSLQTRLGRPLMRTLGPEPAQPALFRLSAWAADWRRRAVGRPAPGEDRAPPRPPGGLNHRALMGRRDLAWLLDRPESQVRFWLPDAAPWGGPWGGLLRGPRRLGPPPALPPDGEGPDGAPIPRLDPGLRPVIGEFIAAAQAPDGRWITVRPQAGPFPNGWQVRIMLRFVGWLAVFALAAFLFARRLTAPISAFARAAEQLGRDPHAPPLALSGPAELGVAARAFNEMQVRIKRYVDDRTAMVGAISHDLRTPLTRIRFKVENAEPALRAAVLSDVAQMEAMISAVLAFIRDANSPAARERLDLLSLLECSVDSAALVGAQVTIEQAEPVIVEAEALGLQRLFGNLIDNAVKYGGAARVSLTVEGGEAVVRVADDGPGLPLGELERVFDPFYRAEPSRNRESGGVGLGLAVARSIARGHGGDVVLEPQATGLTAVVRLPLPA